MHDDRQGGQRSRLAAQDAFAEGGGFRPVPEQPCDLFFFKASLRPNHDGEAAAVPSDQLTKGASAALIEDQGGFPGQPRGSFCEGQGLGYQRNPPPPALPSRLGGDPLPPLPFLLPFARL